METTTHTKFIYIALEVNGRVIAHFLHANDCADFCENGVKYTYMPFNLANCDKEPAPLVGSIYRA
jgi:hypothetical protein